jgi:hypothetical protein
MAQIVVVHGVGQQAGGEHTLHDQLFPALQDGLARAEVQVEPRDVAFPFYGYLFRPPAEVLGFEGLLDASDVRTDYELDLLRTWWSRASATDERVVPPGEETLARSPRWAQGALLALSRSAFFSGLAERALVGDLRQVEAYFTDQPIRAAMRDAVCQRVSEQTRVLIGHSLGSVVAYEVLCAHPEWPVHSFITLGSPLGLRHLVYDRLKPSPRASVMGPLASWPGSVKSWTNVTDAGDVVAVAEDLRPLFSDRIRQIRVHNGAHAHDMRSYLTDPATGTAIAEGLNG